MGADCLQIQHLRHATLILSIAGKRLLVDPMLASKGSLPPIPLTRNRVHNPLVNLPVPLETFHDIDGIVVTHLHSDHFDEVAKETLPKNLPVFCQPADEKKLQSFGFQQASPIPTERAWQNLRFFRVEAHHGKGLVTLLMGQGSGFMVQAEDGHTVYIAGDTIYDDTFAEHIKRFQPQTIIVYAGAARMLFGSPITMTAEDVANVCLLAPNATVVAVHIEAINHCGLSREDLRTYLEHKQFLKQVLIPQDGEIMQL